MQTENRTGRSNGMRRSIATIGALVGLAASVVVAVSMLDTDSSDMAGGASLVATPVVAISEIDPAQVPSEACIKENSCLRQWYQTLTWQIGPQAALDALRAHGTSSEQLNAACHDTTHAIGEIAARMQPIAKAMELGDTSCGSGFYHGVIATTTTMVEPEQLIATLVDGCSDGDGFERWECFHGVGHGFVFAAGGNILNGVDLCTAITIANDRGACGSGAFMQELDDRGGDEKYSKDPYVVCRAMTEPVIAGQCYDMLANLVMIHRSSTEDRFAECRTVPSVNQEDCYRGLGRAKFSGMPFTGEGIESFCEGAGTSDGVRQCYEAAFTNTAAFYGNSEEAATHCDELSTEVLRAMCRDWLAANPL